MSKRILAINLKFLIYKIGNLIKNNDAVGLFIKDKFSGEVLENKVLLNYSRLCWMKLNYILKN